MGTLKKEMENMILQPFHASLRVAKTTREDQ